MQKHNVKKVSASKLKFSADNVVIINILSVFLKALMRFSFEFNHAPPS